MYIFRRGSYYFLDKAAPEFSNPTIGSADYALAAAVKPPYRGVSSSKSDSFSKST